MSLGAEGEGLAGDGLAVVVGEVAVPFVVSWPQAVVAASATATSTTAADLGADHLRRIVAVAVSLGDLMTSPPAGR